MFYDQQWRLYTHINSFFWLNVTENNELYFCYFFCILLYNKWKKLLIFSHDISIFAYKYMYFSENNILFRSVVSIEWQTAMPRSSNRRKRNKNAQQIRRFISHTNLVSGDADVIVIIWDRFTRSHTWATDLC